MKQQISPTTRDLEIFRHIGQRGVSSTAALHRAFWAECQIQTAQARLGQLARAGYLKHQVVVARGQAHHVYALLRKAAALFPDAERRCFLVKPAPGEVAHLLRTGTVLDLLQATRQVSGFLHEHGVRSAVRRGASQGLADGEMLLDGVPVLLEIDSEHYTGQRLSRKVAALGGSGRPVLWAVASQARLKAVSQAAAGYATIEVEYFMHEEDLALLAMIHQLKRPTAADLHRHVLPHQPMSALYRKLEQLERAEMIAKMLLYPERGARSPRSYHLRLAGARALGLERVGSDQYRQPGPAVYHAGQLRRALALVAERHHWRLISEEREARQFLASVLVEAAQVTYGETFPAHTLLPATLQVHPDLLLDTGARVVVVIIGHPYATARFWQKRLDRYHPILGAVAAACFALTAAQRSDAEAAAQASRHARRVLVLGAEELGELVRRLAPSP